MTPKSGKCLDCKFDTYLIAGRCKSCYWKHRSSLKSTETPEAGNEQEIKETPVKRSKIASISKSRKEALKIYRPRRDQYLKDNPVCEFPGCKSRIIQLHHKRGRVGSFLTDKRTFCSLCDKHHKYVHANPEEGRKLGLIDSRLDKFK